ncbi:MlaD family protein [Nocardia bovistercoris]|uniref:MCE family protein n=1 Tax=Nocardia bovistercoris TaxID=2785916 RepID=A0A931I8P1_9NOCA|nr:MlaD family protein [Nocardia bovistercoris]MBH0776709.1 MCE family protein [Nocardia bovistercoris]
MSSRTRTLLTLTKVLAAAVVSALLFVVVLNAIKNPVDGETETYVADFTDASGLHVNGDVRSRGVRIGKVVSVRLVRGGGESLARVEFSLEHPYRLTDATELAIKYQNLTGVRYIDFRQPTRPGAPVDRLAAASTKPSFDITRLFNGLQPVLTTMSTDEINTFTANAIALLEGDGGGLAPMLDSVQRLADLARDREQVVSTLVANLWRISDGMGGRSPQVMEFLRALSIPVDQALTVLAEFEKTSVFGPEFMSPVHRIVTELGLTNDMDIDALLARNFASTTEAARAVRLLPAAIAGLQIPGGAGAVTCANGVATLPTEIEVLLNGSEVVICHAK